MATDADTKMTERDSKGKRALLAIGGFVVFVVIWVITTSFMIGFVQGLAGVNQNPNLQVIAAGVLVAPFAHVLFSRLVDYIIDQM